MKKGYLPVVLIMLLFFSILFYKLQLGEDYLANMKEMAGPGSEVTRLSDQIYEASLNGKVIGYFDQQNAIGYAGPIDVLVFVGSDGQVKDVDILNQTETPSFFHKVISEGFINNFIGKKTNSQFKLSQDIDGITNATYTCRGITEAVRKASHNIAVTQFQMEVPKQVSFKLPIEHYLVLILLFVVFIFQKLKWAKLRYVTLLAGFILIGYWQKSLLTLSNFSSVLSGNISFQNIPFWLILLFGVIILIFLTGRNLYCFWVCPYGAISELLGRFGRFGQMNYTPCERSKRRFKKLRLFLAWAALVFAFLMMNPGISSYEIFAPLFAWEGSSVQWLLLPVMLFAGVFIFRFWCHFFCPVGGILDLLVNCRRSCKQWLESKLRRNKKMSKLNPEKVDLN